MLASTGEHCCSPTTTSWIYLVLLPGVIFTSPLLPMAAATTAWSHASMFSCLKRSEGSSTSTAHWMWATARTAQLLEVRLCLWWVCAHHLQISDKLHTGKLICSCSSYTMQLKLNSEYKNVHLTVSGSRYIRGPLLDMFPFVICNLRSKVHANVCS